MKKILLFLWVLLVSCSGEEIDIAYHDKESSDSVVTLNDQATEWLYKLCSEEFMGRKTGSVGDSLACAYIVTELVKMGYEPELQEFFTENGTKLKNIIVNISGDNDSVIILGAHYDGAKLSSKKVHYPAAEDNASGVVALLAFLKLQQKMPLNTHYSIACCFWDSEEVFEGRAFRGSSHYVRNLENKGLVLMYENLDTVGHEHGGVVRIKYWDWGDGRLINAYDKIIGNGRFNYIGEPTPSGGSSDYAVFGAAKIPYIAYHDHGSESCSHPNHSALDKPDYISVDKILAIVENTCELILYY